LEDAMIRIGPAYLLKRDATEDKRLFKKAGIKTAVVQRTDTIPTGWGVYVKACDADEARKLMDRYIGSL
jgi:hypothetical protein